MTGRKWTRRDAMTAVGGAAVLAPFWRPLRGSAQSAFPKRVITVFSPNGVIDDEFFPSGGERDFQLKQGLEPLQPYRQKILIARGVDLKQPGRGMAHQVGMAGAFTAQPLGGNGFPRGISIDQRIAQEIGTDTRFASIQAATGIHDTAQIYTRMSFRGGGQPLEPEKNPQRFFNRIFEGFVPDNSTGPPDPRAEIRQRLRRSILDRSVSELNTLHRRLGQEDAEKLEFHAQALRDLELRLEETPATPGSCGLPDDVSSGLNLGTDDLDPVAMRHHMDIITRAFACDLTRVASLMLSRAATPAVPRGLGISGRHHSLAHNGARQPLVQIDRWYAERVAELLGMLDSVPEGGGTLLDNTLVIWNNELRDGESHRFTSMPLLLAGGAGGAIEMGRYLTFNGASLADFYTTVVHAFGIRENFGNGASGPLF